MKDGSDHIPSDLKGREQWVVYRLEERGGKKTKVPYLPYNGAPPLKAKADSPNTWRSFDEAEQALSTGHYDGLGFVFGERDPYCGIDLDGVRDPVTGDVNAEAAEIVRTLDSYTEVSPSGTGLHIIVKGSLAELKGRRKGNVEMYDEGRFFTMTGQAYGEPLPIGKRQTQLEQVHRGIFGGTTKQASTRTQPVVDDLRRHPAVLLERAFASKNGAAIRRLWDGDKSAHNDDASAADLALCSHLAFFCDYDLTRVDTLFRRSALMRPKWDEKHASDGRTYGQMTLERASEGRGLGDGYRAKTAVMTVVSEAKPPPPTIQVNERFLREISDDAKNALLAANDPPTIFMRGSIAARVNGEKIEVFTPVTLKSHLDRIADFVKLTERGGELTPVPVRPPADLAPDLLGRLDLGLPELEEVVHAPVFLPDGRLLVEDGYNPQHCILLKLRGLSGLRADLPVDEALGMLDAVFRDFPFTETAGRAHILALILQPFVRPLIQGATPMYLIDAPARGTGKGLLAEVANLIPLGYFAPTMSQPRDSDETEKRITSVLLEARPVVFFDNVTRLGSEPLHAALTSQTWHGRILGKSETVTVPNRAVWLASGNNVELSDEMTRRVIPIRLDAGVERPEERTGFSIPDLPAYVRAHRPELISACLSLAKRWVNEGMPRGTVTLGRFESWAGVMGGILEVSGVSGFLSGRERLYTDADSETKEWTSLCAAWWSQYGTRPVSAKDLFDILKEHDLLLDLWGGRTQQGGLQRLGHALAQRRDRVFGGYKIVSAGRDGVTRSAAYRLERAGNKTTETTEIFGSNSQLSSESQTKHRQLLGGFDEPLSKTTHKPSQNHPGKSAVRNGISTRSSVVPGVSVVLERPSVEVDDALEPASEWEGIDL